MTPGQQRKSLCSDLNGARRITDLLQEMTSAHVGGPYARGLTSGCPSQSSTAAKLGNSCSRSVNGARPEPGWDGLQELGDPRVAGPVLRPHDASDQSTVQLEVVAAGSELKQPVPLV